MLLCSCPLNYQMQLCSTILSKDGLNQNVQTFQIDSFRAGPGLEGVFGVGVFSPTPLDIWVLSVEVLEGV